MTQAAAASALPVTVRVLIVEDSAADAELETRELKRAGLRIEFRVVQREDALRQALAEFSPHVVLSDFTMPHFSGMDALAVVRELAPDLPFIFVSGTLGEDYAIRALKNGASDYVLKSNLVRLPAAVERAMHEAAERRARQQAERMFQDVVEFAPDPMVVADATGNIALVNARLEALFGYRRDELLGKALETLIPETQRPRHEGLRESHVLHRDGRRVPVEVSLAAVGGHNAARVVASLRDLTERREQERRIARLSRVRQFTSSINSALVRLRDRQAMFNEVCRVAVEVAGFLRARIGVLETPSADVAWISAHGRRDSPEGALMVSARDDESGAGIAGHALRSGEPALWNNLAAEPHPRAKLLAQAGARSVACFPLLGEGTVVGLLVLHAAEPGYFDSDEMQLLRELAGNVSFALESLSNQERVSYLALYDPLTGLANRALFCQRLAAALDAAGHAGKMVALIGFDLERFKAINDAFGWSTGDRLLQAVARRLEQFAGESNRLARLGGNVFAAFLTVGSMDEVPRRLESTMARFFKAPFPMDGRDLRVAARGGIALFPGDGADADTLLRNAEAALKRAKETSEPYLYYAPKINARVAEQVELENRLRRAVDAGELALHFQPKVDLQTRRIVGAEALMRWLPAEGTAVSPATFIPVLEQTGLIVEAGRQAMMRAAATYREWRARGLNPPRVAVNISALQLRRKTFVEEVERAIGSPAGDAGVDLEITESLLMTDVEESILKLARLREIGMRVALDDFGTGHSSLSYLSRLPIDTLKIDRSFVHGMLDNASDTSIVSTIISLAQSLRLMVVAEGVESEEQARLLRLLRCDQAQGYLFSPPVGADELAALLGAASAAGEPPG